MRKLKLRQINWFAQHHKKLGKTRWIHIQTQFFFGCEASCGILLPQSGEVSSPNHWTSRELQPTPVFLPGESQGRGSLVRCRLWGRTESDTTEAT